MGSRTRVIRDLKKRGPAQSLSVGNTVATPPGIRPDLDFFSDLLFSSQTLDSMLDGLLSLAVLEVPGSSGASITLMDGATYRTSAHTSALFKAVDAVQYDEGLGPCLQAIQTGEIVEADFRNTAEWPGLGPRALEFGVVKVVAAPLLTGGELTGSINIYATAPDAFDEGTKETVGLVAQVLTILLRNFELYDRRGELVDQLYEALESRSAIDLAKGILMEREDIDSGDAFSKLRTESQARNIKVREVAMRIVQAREKST